MADGRGRDQFVVRWGDETEVFWNDAPRGLAEEARAPPPSRPPLQGRAPSVPRGVRGCCRRPGSADGPACRWSADNHMCRMRKGCWHTDSRGLLRLSAHVLERGAGLQGWRLGSGLGETARAAL